MQLKKMYCVHYGRDAPFDDTANHTSNLLCGSLVPGHSHLLMLHVETREFRVRERDVTP